MESSEKLPQDQNQSKPIDMRLRVSPAVIKRMALYLDALEKLQRDNPQQGSFYVSSRRIGELSGVKPVQARKDFSFFGTFGTPGVGYEADELKRQIIKILNLGKKVGLAFVGIGRLGSALVRYYNDRYRELGNAYYETRALFDSDEDKVGTKIEDLEILSIEELQDKVRELSIKVGVLTVPAEAAQYVADHCVESGMKAILNFAPAAIKVPDNVKVQNVDLTVELEHLGYYL